MKRVSSSPVKMPASKKHRADVATSLIKVLIPNNQQFKEMIQIISGVSNVAELTVTNNMLHFKLMSSANVSCCSSEFSCETPDFPSKFLVDGVCGPFFIDLGLFELCLSTKLYSKLSSGIETLLCLNIKPDEKITISMVSPVESATKLPYLGKHSLRLLESTPVGLSMDSMEYEHTVRFSIADLKALLEQMRQFKIIHLTVQILASEDNVASALRISARNIRHSTKHTFFCSRQNSDGETSVLCANTIADNMESSQAASSSVMRVVLSQSFYCSHILKLVKSMSDHYVRFLFSENLPLCVRYDFTTQSFLQYFLCQLSDDADADAIANMPAVPDEDAV